MLPTTDWTQIDDRYITHHHLSVVLSHNSTHCYQLANNRQQITFCTPHTCIIMSSVIAGTELLKKRTWAVVGDVLNVNKPAGMSLFDKTSGHNILVMPSSLT